MEVSAIDITKEVENRLSLFKNLYDFVRIIDPVAKKIIISSEEKEENLEKGCYCLWNRNSSCENCISMRAFLEGETFVKLEYKDNQVFMVISVPIEFRARKLVVELIKDISKKGYIKSENINSLVEAEFLISQMNDMVVKDKLTGVYNRRYLDERLPLEINLSLIKGQPLTIIIADIDNFKEVNDKYGHLIGDKVIRDFARLLNSFINGSGNWLARYGGDEFLIVLKNTNLDEAYKVSEAIRKKVEGTEFQYGELKIRITSSFGVYCLNNTDLNAEELILRVDKNLYDAKRTGRNRIVINER